MVGQTSAVFSRVSVVIPNYNYGRFLGAAVDSALHLDWPDVEVIVVDDGSTDDSLEVLARYGERVRLLRQPNSGPRVACNRGYAASSGDLVIFLDSDDELDPSLLQHVAAVWHPAVSKVQVQMQRVDEAGVAFGPAFPSYRTVPTPDDLRTWLTATGAYPTPPGSGNIYSRTFLEQIFPLGDSCGDATDSACLAAAPLLGDVLTIAAPLVRYRVHADNRSKLDEPSAFTRQIERALQRQHYAFEVGDWAGGSDTVVSSLRRGRHLAQMRVAEGRLNPGTSPVPRDTRLRQIFDSVTGVAAPGPEPWWQRLVIASWCVATAVAPHPVAVRLISQRFGWHRHPRAEPALTASP